MNSTVLPEGILTVTEISDHCCPNLDRQLTPGRPAPQPATWIARSAAAELSGVGFSVS
jgi:hypothetical protein